MLKKLIFVIVAIGAMSAGIWVSHTNKAELTLLSGQQYQWQDFNGQWLVVNYFAQWCAPCLKEIPELNLFDQQVKNTDTRLIAISWDNLSQSQLQQIADQYAIEFDLVYQVEPDSLPFVKPAQLPATFIVSPQGKVLKTLMGEQTALSLQQQIAQLKNK